VSSLLLSLGWLQQRDKGFGSIRGLDQSLFEESILFKESFEVAFDVFEFFKIFLRIDRSEREVGCLIFEQSQNWCISISLGLDTIIVVESSCFVRQPLQKLVIDLVLLFFNAFHFTQNFLLRNLKLNLSFPDLEQLFKGVGKVSLVLDVHLIKFPSIVDSEERSNFHQSLLSCPLEFVKNVLDSFDKLYFLVLWYLSLLDFAIKYVVVFLLWVEKRLNLCDVFRWFGPHKGLQSILDSIQISAYFDDLSIFFLQLSKLQSTCLSIVLSF